MTVKFPYLIGDEIVGKWEYHSCSPTVTPVLPSMRRHILTLIAISVACLAVAEVDNPETGANKASQAAADEIKSAAGTDAAFLAAALVKKDCDKENLASILQYPTDQIVVVNLSGTLLKQALERSVSLYPQPNTSFLQLSGVEATFKKSAASGSRIITVTVAGSPISADKTYSIAMPASLGRGGLGYFKIWDKTKIVKTLDKTAEEILKGKKFVDTSPRWSVQ